MENNNRESLFANAARETFGSIGRFAKDLYSAISENSRTSKDIDKANSSDDVYEKKIKSQENKLNDLLERSQYLNSLISKQFKELINNLKSFLNSVTGGLGLGALGGIAATAAAAPFFEGPDVVDLSDVDYDPENPATPESPAGPESPAEPRSNTNIEGEPISEDLAAPLEGAEEIDVEFSPGPRRPNPPSYGVVNAVRNAVFSTFGEGYRIVITSGEGEYGSERHREAAGGAAIDYKIVDPDGNPVNINDSRIRNYLKSLGEQGIKGHGMGREYMGEYTMHSDIFPRENYTAGMGPTWGDGWNDNEDLEPGQKSLRETFLEASRDVETPLTGGSVEIQDGMVRLPTLEEFIQELDVEPEEELIEEDITTTPEPYISGGGGNNELTGGSGVDELPGGGNLYRTTETEVPETSDIMTTETPEVPEAPVPEVPLVPEAPVPEVPLVPETPVPEAPLVPETPVPEAPLVPETPVPEAPLVPETPVPETPETPEPNIEVTETPETPEPNNEVTETPETPEPNIEVTETPVPETNPTQIIDEDTDSPPIQSQQTPTTDQEQETPQYEQTARSDPPKPSKSIQNFLNRSDYKVEQEPTYA